MDMRQEENNDDGDKVWHTDVFFWEEPRVVDVIVEIVPVGAFVHDLLPDVLGVHVVVQHAGMLVVGVVLHVYIPSSPPGVAVGPDMNLASCVHHLVVSAVPDRGRCRHRTGGRAGPTGWSPW